MTAATKSTKAPAEGAEPAVDTPTPTPLDALKDKLRRTGEMLCDIDSYCGTAIETIYAKLFPNETVPQRKRWDFTTKLANGDKTVDVKMSALAYSEEHAFNVALRDKGFTALVTAPDLAPPAAGEDPADVKALKTSIRKLAEHNANNIRKDVLNKYLAWMGIEELPVVKRYTFHVPAGLETLRYVYDANSEKEAREGVDRYIAHDNTYIAQGGRRDYGKPVAQPASTVEADLILHGDPTVVS